MRHKIINNTIIKIASVFCVLFLISHFSPLISNTYASAHVLRVSPIIINVPLSPGKTYTHEVTVENITDTPLPLRASLSDFQTTGEEGGYVFAETHTNPLLSWIELSDTDMILNPKEQKTVLLTIKTPEKIPLGGYYGVLFFEVIPLTEITDTTRVIPKIGVLMLANVGVPDPNAQKAEILTYQTGFFHHTNTLPLLLRVKNISLHYFTAKPILTISPLIPLPNSQNETHFLEEKIVFQGNTRRWEEHLTLKNVLPNMYKASLQVSTGNGQMVTKETYFVIFPVLQTSIVLFALVLILYIIKKRKRLGKAIKALIR